MLYVCVPGIPAFAKPSTSASATTGIAGFLVSAALRTHLAAYRGSADLRGCFRWHPHGHMAARKTQSIQLPLVD